MSLSHILYRSYGRLDDFQRDCDAILAEARARNASTDLTGFLHAEDGMFVQWLEGPGDQLDAVVDMIRSDDRHRDMTVYSKGPIEARFFSRWTMGFSNGEKAPLFDWLAERGTNSHDLRAFGNCLHEFLLLRAA